MKLFEASAGGWGGGGDSGGKALSAALLPPVGSSGDNRLIPAGELTGGRDVQLPVPAG